MTTSKFMGKAKIIPVKNALLLPYQEQWVKDKSQIKMMQKSRQIGISWASAYALVRRKALDTAALDAWCSSRDDAQARLLLNDCAAFARLLQIGAEDLGSVVVDSDRDIRSYVLKFSNGLKINSMSSNPDAQAGKRGDRFFDEFALHKDPKKLYDIGLPGITWGGQLEIVSTHRGSKNFFNLLIREILEKGNPKGISLHTVTLEDALNQGFLYKLQLKLNPNDKRQAMDEADYFNYIKSSCSSEEAFLQEYMCVPADDNALFIPYELLARCEYDERDHWEQPLDTCKNALYMGVDIGRHHDLTVLWIIEKMGDQLQTRKIIELQKMSFSEQEKVLWNYFKLSNCHRICIDATGLGMQFAERAKEAFGSHKVESITFSQQAKEQMAFGLKAKMEDNLFKMPFSNALRDDFTAIKKEISLSGNIRFSADRGKNGHSDRFWAAALAVSAIGNDQGAYFWENANENKSNYLLPTGNEDVINERRAW